MAAGSIVEWKERGFGFIRPDSGGRDVFFHTTSFAGDLSQIALGTRVTYDLAPSDGRKPKAVNVKPAGQRSTPPPPAEDLECAILDEAEFRELVTGVISKQVPEIVNGITEIARENGWLE